MQQPPIDPAKQALVNAALPHVAFDGWGPQAFKAAVAETGINPDHARTMCPRGATDLAIAYHRMGDASMVAALKDADLSDLRFRDKVARAIRLRLDAITDKEAVRRGTALFALPHLAADGAKLIWGTADLIWDTLGDRADDINWYTKRATLAGVYGAVVLYWLGDDSVDAQATDDFIDRRISNVMQIETAKARLRENPLTRPMAGAFERLTGMVKAPARMPPMDVPGSWRDPE